MYNVSFVDVIKISFFLLGLRNSEGKGPTATVKMDLILNLVAIHSTPSTRVSGPNFPHS